MRYTVKPHNVCAASLSFDLDDDVVEEVAKQKLGLVKPDEVLLKPRPKDH